MPGRRRPSGAAAQWRERLGDDGAGARDVVGDRRRASTSSRAELLRRVPLSGAAAPATPSRSRTCPAPSTASSGPRASRGFSVERVDDGVFRVEGDGVERLLARHDLDNDEALAHVERRLRRMGVISALEAQGFEPGDDVEIAGVVFELHPG